MRKTKILLIVQTVLLYLFVVGAHAEMSSTSYIIPTSVMSGGGNTMSSANFNIVSTLGQPTVLGIGSSSSYSSYPGFVYTLMLAILMGDVNGDGSINLKDVISALQVVTGQTTASIYLEADANEDGHIGIAEALMVLIKLSD